MKGKGKKGRDSEDECPLMLLDFKSIDIKDCPRLASILSRTEAEGVPIEELDSLQLELESLLVSVIARKEQIENETESLINWQDSKLKGKKSTVKGEISGKRSKVIDERGSKKLKDSLSLTSSSGKSHSMRYKVKNVKQQDFEYNEPVSLDSFPRSETTRNDMPDRFWNFIEPYCGPIKPDDIKFLEDTLKTTDLDSDYLKVPNLGKHYTLKWMQEDGWERKNETDKSSSVHTDKKKGLSPYNSVSLEEKSPKRFKDAKTDPDKCSFGFLTQRLVSCLIEENFSINGDGIDFDFDFNTKNGHSSNYLFKSINFGNTNGLEKRIRKELEEQGLLDPDLIFCNDVSPTEEDEIMKELIQCQSDLKSVNESNQMKLKQLIEEAKKSMERQSWITKLEAADVEIIEIYKRILSAKQKKRTFSKKEREQAMKALKDRETIVNKIDSIK